MRKISCWAKQHPAIAILFIVVLNGMIGLLALFTGTALYNNGIILPRAIAVFSVPLLAFLYLVYPRHKHHYSKRKMLEFAFLIPCFISFTVLCNKLNDTGSSY